MNRFLQLVAIVGLSASIGCGSGPTTRDNSIVDVKATVTGADGKPLSKTLVVVLQPSGDTLGAKLEATMDGTFSGKAAPGRYIYYVKMAKSDTPPKGVPAKFTDPKEENTIEVAAGKPLEIKLTN